MLRSRENAFYKNTLVLHFYPKIPSPWNDIHDIYNILSPYHENDTDHSVED